MQYANYNHSGKIWISIQDHIKVTVISDIKQQLSLQLEFVEFENQMLTTVVYAKCFAKERLDLCDNIYYLHMNNNLPWMIGSDFNVILSDEEKIVCLLVYPQEYEDFVFCVNSCDLMDVNFKGSPFTWWNRRIDNECIFKRLDSLFVNQELMGIFGGVDVEHLARTGSDHAPC